MIKEIDDLYCCLGKLEEAYYTDSLNPPECLTIHEARMKLEAAISRIEMLLTQLSAQTEVPGVQAE